MPSTEPTCRARSAASSPMAASACSTTTSPISTAASPSERRWSWPAERSDQDRTAKAASFGAAFLLPEAPAARAPAVAMTAIVAARIAAGEQHGRDVSGALGRDISEDAPVFFRAEIIDRDAALAEQRPQRIRGGFGL